jgi:hypothetical protein
MTQQLSLTYTPAELHAASLATIGESALVMVVARATLLETAAGTAAATERATGRRNPRPELKAWSELGEALMHLDVACRRLEDAGMFEKSRELNARKDRRIRALDRAS